MDKDTRKLLQDVLKSVESEIDVSAASLADELALVEAELRYGTPT